MKKRIKYIKAKELFDKGQPQELLIISELISGICKEMPIENEFRKKYILIKEAIPIEIVDIKGSFDKKEMIVSTMEIKKSDIENIVSFYLVSEKNDEVKNFLEYIIGAIRLTLKNILKQLENEIFEKGE